MRGFFAVIAALCLVACASGARDQAAADAYAGAQAVAHAAPQLAPVAGGIAVNALATRGAQSPDDLPAPLMAPVDILLQPDVYRAQAEKTHSESMSSGFWAMLGGGALLALGVVSRLGLGGPIVGVLSGILENAATKKQRQKAQSLAGFGVTAIEIIEALPEEIGGVVKKQISKAVTPEQEKAIREVLSEGAKG